MSARRFYLSDYNGNIAAEHEADSKQDAVLYFKNAGYDLNEYFVIDEDDKEIY